MKIESEASMLAFFYTNNSDLISNLDHFLARNELLVDFYSGPSTDFLFYFIYFIISLPNSRILEPKTYVYVHGMVSYTFTWNID